MKRRDTITCHHEQSLIADSWNPPQALALVVFYKVKIAHCCLVPLTVPLSALVTHLTMWPTFQDSCQPCDSRDAPDSLTTPIMRSGSRIERNCLTSEKEVAVRERERETTTLVMGWYKKYRKVQKAQTLGKWMCGVFKSQDKRETEGSLVEQMDVSVHKWTDGKCLCVEWQMSQTFPNVPDVHTMCSFGACCSLLSINIRFQCSI